jgi:hypothetical protein
VRLVTGVAGDASGVIGGDDLGESFGLGAVGLVAAGADDGSVELWWLYGGRVVGVPGLGSVAGLAGDDNVLAQLFLIDYLSMATLANIVAGEGGRPGRDFSNGRTAIVSVLAETVGDNESTQANESNQGDCHNGREPDEMFNILEQGVRRSPGASCAQQSAMLLDT